MKSVWIIEGLDCSSGYCRTIEGFVESKQEANALVDKLNENASDDAKLWIDHCINCPVMCNDFKSAREALRELKKMKNEVTCNCQQLEISEECPGDFYVICKRQPQMHSGYIYTTREIFKMK